MLRVSALLLLTSLGARLCVIRGLCLQNDLVLRVPRWLCLLTPSLHGTLLMIFHCILLIRVSVCSVCILRFIFYFLIMHMSVYLYKNWLCVSSSQATSLCYLWVDNLFWFGCEVSLWKVHVFKAWLLAYWWVMIGLDPWLCQSLKELVAQSDIMGWL